MHRKQKKHTSLPALLYSLFLISASLFILLDAFVIPRDVVIPESLSSTSSAASDDVTPSQPGSEDVSSSSSDSQTSSTVSQPIITENSYQSQNISIQITTLRQYDTQIYLVDILLRQPSLLRTALAQGAFGRNLRATTSQIAQENQAILAINGDYYGFRDEGYVLRNGSLYRDTPREDDGQALALYADGTMEIVSESEVSAQTMMENGAVQIFSFGPGLVIDGEIAVDAESEVEQSMNSNPRTAIGIIEPLHYLFVVSDGRTQQSEGLTLLELAEIMQEQGCTQAYNLDGGGSSTLWFMGEVINQPTTNGRTIKERSVSDIVYIGE